MCELNAYVINLCRFFFNVSTQGILRFNVESLKFKHLAGEILVLYRRYVKNVMRLHYCSVEEMYIEEYESICCQDK